MIFQRKDQMICVQSSHQTCLGNPVTKRQIGCPSLFTFMSFAHYKIRVFHFHAKVRIFYIFDFNKLFKHFWGGRA